MDTRPVPKAAEDLVKQFEGLTFKAYPDPGTRGAPYTVGYGHTEGVFKDTIVDSDTVERLLALDLRKTCNAVLKYVTVPLSDNELAALISFTFNVGAGAFSKSTLVRFLNEGKRQEAADQFLRWDKAAGKQMPGLVRRRAAERDLFLKR